MSKDHPSEFNSMRRIDEEAILFFPPSMVDERISEEP
jgi:hypothetical protein